MFSCKKNTKTAPAEWYILTFSENRSSAKQFNILFILATIGPVFSLDPSDSLDKTVNYKTIKFLFNTEILH